MDLLGWIAFGIVVPAVIAAAVLMQLGVGDSSLDPIGVVVVACSRLAKVVNRRRSVPLPPGVPPPPGTP